MKMGNSQLIRAFLLLFVSLAISLVGVNVGNAVNHFMWQYAILNLAFVMIIFIFIRNFYQGEDFVNRRYSLSLLWISIAILIASLVYSMV